MNQKTFKMFLLLALFIPLSAKADAAEAHAGYMRMQQQRAQDCQSKGGSFIMDDEYGESCLMPQVAGQNVDYVDRVRDQANQCEQATKSAKQNCDFDNSQSGKQIISMASQMKSQIQSGAQTSAAALCSQMGTFAQTMNAAVAAYSAYCSAGFASCSDACDTASDTAESAKRMASSNPAGNLQMPSIEIELVRIRDQKRICGSLAGSVNAVQQNIGNYANVEKMKADACGKALGGAANCVANPNTPQCQQMARNCANPTYAASNTVCICMKNPNDPRCGSAGVNAGFVQKPGGGASSSSAARGAGADGGKEDFGGMGSEFSGGINAVPNPNMGNDGPGGGKGGPKSMGQANLNMGDGQNKGGAAAGAGGAAGSGINTKIIGGYGYGGRGGSGNFGGGAGGGGYGSGGGGSYMGRTATGPNGRPVDLRQFLPGGKMDPSRAMAGISGPDGITGPNTDIWSKIRVRYFKVSPTLLP